jgi:hypothetical protein
MRLGVAGLERQQPVEALQRLVMAGELAQRVGAVDQRFREIGLE